MRDTRPARRVWRHIGAVLAGLVSVALLASPASAHATLLSTDPADGAVLDDAPAEVGLTFDEPVEVRSGAVRLLDATGVEVSAQARSVDTRVVLAVPQGVADGTYILTWRVISTDGHPVAGGFSFSIGAPSAGVIAVPVVEPATGLRLLRQTLEGFAYLGLLIAGGVIVFQLVLVRGATDIVQRRLWGAARWVTVLAGVATVLLVPVVAAYQDGAGLPAVFANATWVEGLASDSAISAALVIVGLGVALLVTHPNRRHTPLANSLGFAATALALGSPALVGHTRTFGPGWLVPAVDMLHVATAAIWLGGIAALIITLLPTSKMTALSAARTVAGFSSIAASVVFVLAAAGTVLGWRILNSWSGLFTTAYGYALLTKVALVLVVVAIASYNRSRLVPAITGDTATDTDGQAWRRLRRTVRAEAVVLVVIVAATGVLVTQSPSGNDTLTAASQPPGPIAQQAALGVGTARIRITPGTIGVNAIELSITDAAGQPLVPVASPEMTVSLRAMDVGPLDRPLSQTGPGRYQAVADFPLPGTWTISLSVRTTQFDYPVTEFTVEIR